MAIGSSRRSVAAVLVIAVLAGACTSGGTGGSMASLPPNATPSEAPAATPGPSVASSAPTAAGSLAAGSPVPSAPSADVPPPATLAVDGGDPVTGQLGSYTWNGDGSDSPWLPGSPIAVGAGERLTVALAGHPGIAEWAAKRATAGSLDGAGAVALGHETAEIGFGAPPSGTWSVQLTVRFAGDRGSAAYYWKVTVP